MLVWRADAGLPGKKIPCSISLVFNLLYNFIIYSAAWGIDLNNFKYYYLSIS